MEQEQRKRRNLRNAHGGLLDQPNIQTYEEFLNTRNTETCALSVTKMSALKPCSPARRHFLEILLCTFPSTFRARGHAHAQYLRPRPESNKFQILWHYSDSISYPIIQLILAYHERHIYNDASLNYPGLSFPQRTALPAGQSLVPKRVTCHHARALDQYAIM